MKILFMCVANSARSQIAEGLAKQIFGSNAEIESAGSQPTKVNPFAIQVLKESEIDISRHFSKSFEQLSPRFIVQLDYVITLCAEEVCPRMTSRAENIHWPFQDPAGKPGTDEEQLQRFRKTRDEIAAKLMDFGREKKLLQS